MKAPFNTFHNGFGKINGFSLTSSERPIPKHHDLGVLPAPVRESTFSLYALTMTEVARNPDLTFQYIATTVSKTKPYIAGINVAMDMVPPYQFAKQMVRSMIPSIYSNLVNLEVIGVPGIKLFLGCPRNHGLQKTNPCSCLRL